MTFLRIALLSSSFLVACGGGNGEDIDSVSSIISPTEGGSLSLEGTETGLTIPGGAVEADIEVTLAVGSVDEFASNDNALDTVLVFSPTMSLSKTASITFELAEDFDFTQRVHIEQFVDGVWIRPELSGLEIGSGGIAFGNVQVLAPTAIVVNAVEPN